MKGDLFAEEPCGMNEPKPKVIPREKAKLVAV